MGCGSLMELQALDLGGASGSSCRGNRALELGGVRFQSSGGQALGCPHSPWSPSSSYTAAHKKNPNA